MSMTAFEATVYGVVQGLTEFIPISSNAHLEVTSVAMTGRDLGAAFTAVIQWGTWVACVIYFRKDISRLAAGVLPRHLGEPALRHAGRKTGVDAAYRHRADRRRGPSVQARHRE